MELTEVDDIPCRRGRRRHPASSAVVFVVVSVFVFIVAVPKFIVFGTGGIVSLNCLLPLDQLGAPALQLLVRCVAVVVVFVFVFVLSPSSLSYLSNSFSPSPLPSSPLLPSSSLLSSLTLVSSFPLRSSPSLRTSISSNGPSLKSTMPLALAGVGRSLSDKADGSPGRSTAPLLPPRRGRSRRAWRGCGWLPYSPGPPRRRCTMMMPTGLEPCPCLPLPRRRPRPTSPSLRRWKGGGGGRATTPISPSIPSVGIPIMDRVSSGGVRRRRVACSRGCVPRTAWRQCPDGRGGGPGSCHPHGSRKGGRRARGATAPALVQSAIHPIVRPAQ